MANARQVAFSALCKLQKDSSYSNIALDSFLSKSELDTRDKSFVSALFYGVIERQITLDYNLSLYLSKPLKKLKPEVLTIMRMGAYQLLFMEKVPSSAAVNESIKLSKKNSLQFASGLINAVLRKISINGLCLPEDKNEPDYLSVKYSCSKWLVEKWLREYGRDDTEKMLESSLGASDVYIRVNTSKIDSDSLIAKLKEEGIESEKTYLENALKISFGGNDIDRIESFRNGLFHVQDLACQLAVKALDIRSGDIVFDLCSAPGGKAFTAAQYCGKNGSVTGFDIYEKRVELIRKGAERLSLDNVKASVGDSSVFNIELGLADRVLCDVPCSGFGIIGRKPEIKYKDESEAREIEKLQYPILENASKYVKTGGKLLYSTCTLSKAENEEVAERFLKEHKDFISVKPLPEISDERYVTLMPHKNKTDGFFMALFERTEQE